MYGNSIYQNNLTNKSNTELGRIKKFDIQKFRDTGVRDRVKLGTFLN
jgi:hypothetical protein